MKRSACSCEHMKTSGTFTTHLMDKPPFKPFRVQSVRDDGAINHGDYDTIDMARAGACGSDAVILVRKQDGRRA